MRRVPRTLTPRAAHASAVALNGCSLTIGDSERDAESGEAWFSVYLIPETLRVTVFGELREGDAVNVEVESQTQVIVDTVERVVGQRLAGMAGAAAA